jgi:hypothetical protein
MTDRHPPRGHAACPGDELLIAYLTASSALAALPSALSDIERSRIEEHLQTCGSCVQALAMMQRRLGVTAEIPAPVPGAVAELLGVTTPQLAADGAAVAPPQHSGLSTQHSRVGWFGSIRDRLSAVLRLPVLVPAAVAAVAVLVVAVQQSWRRPALQPEMSRVLERHERLRVTAEEALVRTQPAFRQPVVATLRRGTSVKVIGEEGDWYRVVLADGKQGWMERRAFE